MICENSIKQNVLRFVLIVFLKGKNEVLTEVDLSWNQIRLKGATEIAQALGKSDLSQEQLQYDHGPTLSITIEGSSRKLLVLLLRGSVEQSSI